MKQDNFKNRYIIKLASSVLIAVCNVLTQLILPRALGVEDYGYYNYNLNIFTSIVVMANLSTSNAMVAKYAKRNDDLGLIYFYLKFFGLVALLLTVGIAVLYPTAFMQSTFAGQTIFIVLLGLQVAILNKLLTDTISIYDAAAVSRFPAVMQILMKAAISLVVLIGFVLGRLKLIWFYGIQISITLVVVAILLVCILKNQHKQYPEGTKLSTKAYLKEYYHFCKPLVYATIFSQLTIIIMNWALMKWSGATQQAMFGAAWQLNTLISYVFSPYAELSKREFAVLHKDPIAMRDRYHQSLQLMAWLTSYFAVFVAVMVDWLLPILYGEQYAGAGMVTILMMFYTIYQAWGQISGAYMIAVEKTKLSAVLTIMGQGLTLLFVFLFQIPNGIWPESLGSIGIALNYLVTNIIATTITISYTSHYLKIPVLKVNTIPMKAISLCAVTALVLKFVFSSLIPGDAVWMLLVKTFVVGCIYTAILATVIYFRPDMVGISREKVKELVRRRK